MDYSSVDIPADLPESKDETAAAPATRFTDEQAEKHLFPAPPPEITIGGRVIPVRPLNAAGVMTVFRLIRDLVKPAFASYREFKMQQDAYVRAYSEGDETAQPPLPMWWIDILADEKNLDAILLAVTTILQRGDPTVSYKFIEENLEPIVDLQKLIPLVAEGNALTELLKKLLRSELANVLSKTKMPSTNSPTRSDSETLSPTSPSTTE